MKKFFANYFYYRSAGNTRAESFRFSRQLHLASFQGRLVRLITAIVKALGLFLLVTATARADFITDLRWQHFYDSGSQFTHYTIYMGLVAGGPYPARFEQAGEEPAIPIAPRGLPLVQALSGYLAAGISGATSLFHAQRILINHPTTYFQVSANYVYRDENGVITGTKELFSGEASYVQADPTPTPSATKKGGK